MSKEEIKRGVKRAMRHMPKGVYIRRLMLFGSHLHGDAQPGSDVDLIAEFDESATISIFDLVRIQRELGQSLQREVDLTTPNGLNKYIREKVLNEAELVYERREAATS